MPPSGVARIEELIGLKQLLLVVLNFNFFLVSDQIRQGNVSESLRWARCGANNVIVLSMDAQK